MKFLLHTQIGIEKITKVELISKFKSLFSFDYIGYIPHKNGLVQIDWKSDFDKFNFAKLGSVEDVFLILSYVGGIPIHINLNSIKHFIDLDSFKKWLYFCFEHKLLPKTNKFKFRLVVRKKSPHNFRRIDLQNYLLKILSIDKNIEILNEDGHPEIWVTLVKNRLVIGFRLTDRYMRHRYYKKEGIPGSLRPSIAFSMAFISNIHKKDVIWDPFCGAGTICCEVLENFKFKKIICSDISDIAINTTKTNLKGCLMYRKYSSKISVKQNNFFDSKDYANIIITNLPFGNKYPIDTSSFISNFNYKINNIKNLRKVTFLYSDKLNLNGWQLVKIFKLKVLGFDCYLQVHNKIN